MEHIENKFADSKEEINKPPLLTIHDHMNSMKFETEFEATEQGLVSLKSLKVFQSHEIINKKLSCVYYRGE